MTVNDTSICTVKKYVNIFKVNVVETLTYFYFWKVVVFSSQATGRTDCATVFKIIIAEMNTKNKY